MRQCGCSVVGDPQEEVGDFPQKEVGNFQDDCATVRRLGNGGCSKKSIKNKLVNRGLDKQSENVTVWPKRMASTQLATSDPRTCPGPEDRSII